MTGSGDERADVALAGAAPTANKEIDSTTRATITTRLAYLTVIMDFALSLDEATLFGFFGVGRALEKLPGA